MCDQLLRPSSPTPILSLRCSPRYHRSVSHFSLLPQTATSLPKQDRTMAKVLGERTAETSRMQKHLDRKTPTHANHENSGHLFAGPCANVLPRLTPSEGSRVPRFLLKSRSLSMLLFSARLGRSYASSWCTRLGHRLWSPLFSSPQHHPSSFCFR